MGTIDLKNIYESMILDSKLIIDDQDADSVVMELDDNFVDCINSDDHKVCIYGGAGTGKTFVVIAKAIRLRAENPDSKICIVVKTNNTWQYVSSIIKKLETKYNVQLSIDVEKIDKLLYIFQESQFVYSNEKKYFVSREEELENVAWEETKEAWVNSEGFDSDRFDHILVDEAIDLVPWYFEFLSILSRDGSLTVMVDGHQKLDFNKKLPEFRKEGYTEKFLKRSFRSTDKIISFAKKISFKVDNIESVFKDNRNVEIPRIIEAISEEKELEMIAQYVQMYKGKSLGIITFKKFDRDKIKNYLSSKNLTIASNVTDPGVHVLTVSGSKGLQFNTVIIPFVENYKKSFTHLYVAVTRARINLDIYKTKGKVSLVDRFLN